jgi:ribosome biogenesis SPOUT family RNA methylase Rps3
VLDPEASKTLEPFETKNYSYFIFGGILGDYPPKKRTRQELTKFIKNSAVRDIGKEQMSTDNAVFTTSLIVSGKKLEELEFKDNVSIELNEFESVDLPYRYNLVKGKPFMSQKIVNYLKKKKGF